MRKVAYSLAIACVIAAGATVGSANAMTISTPAAVRAALEQSNLVEETAYYCKRVRRCNVAGYCRVRRVCRVW